MSVLTLSESRRRLLAHDCALIGIMAVLAACGLIYEYLLSHFAARILGAIETTLYAMIGLMIVAMGMGSLTAKYLKKPFSSFAWLEVIVALLGMSSILIIAGLLAFTHELPRLIVQHYQLPDGVTLLGFSEKLDDLVYFMPFFMGFILGFLIGMEIPLIARIRQQLYGQYLENNAGTIYGVDYIGAGIGAVIWISVMLSMDIVDAAVATALFNIAAGMLFVILHFSTIRHAWVVVAGHVLTLILALVLFFSGKAWMHDLSNVLYQDEVVLSYSTDYQHLTITERQFSDLEPVNDFFINGRLQFSTSDEHIYHSMLVYPAMLASARNEKVLIVGGGDGLALRDVFRWPDVQQVTLIDLDRKLVNLFAGNDTDYPELSQRFVELNEGAFQDPRLELIFGDAFVELRQLEYQRRMYDTIIIDLPDPHHPDLNNLYSTAFYTRLKGLLAGDGAMVVQSTSPYHAKFAFQSIGKTVKASGFAQVEQYRQNVPSFGEWGWTIATKMGASPQSRIADWKSFPVEDDWLTRPLLLGAFEFPKNFYSNINTIKVNELGSGVLFQYHDKAWRQDDGHLWLKNQ